MESRVRNDDLNLTGEGLHEAPGRVLVAAVQGEQQEARQPRTEAQVLGSPHTPHITILSHFVTLCHTMSQYCPHMSHYDLLLCHTSHLPSLSCAVQHTGQVALILTTCPGSWVWWPCAATLATTLVCNISSDYNIVTFTFNFQSFIEIYLK